MSEDPATAFHIRFPASLLAAADARASQEGLTRTRLIIKALLAYLDRQPPG